MTTATRHLRTAPALLLLLLLALAGCGGGGGGGSSSSSGSADASSSAAGGSTGAEAPSDAGGARSLDTTATGDTSSAKAAAPLSRAVVSTGQLTLHAPKVATARAEVVRLTTAWGGTVADEQTTGDDHGRLVDSTMTLRVPTARFSVAMDTLARVGDVEQQSRTSQDVTTKVVDNDARVRAAGRSIRQIELLLSRATKIADIIAIESDLARRQADLDSLSSQQAYLADQTSLSTITVYLSRSMPRAATPQDADGFLTGLGNGWDALTGATVVLLTAVGAVLPFALVLGLLGVPLWLVLRRRRALASAPTPTATEA